jgi:hypothetical protein
MALSQLTSRESRRDIECCLRALEEKGEQELDDDEELLRLIKCISGALIRSLSEDVV